MNKLRFLIVGSGYRAELYGRIAAGNPELFEALFLCRSAEKAELMRIKTGTMATVSSDEAESFRPDFVVIAVNKDSIAKTACLWARRGYAVLAETPAGTSGDELLELWNAHEAERLRIIFCEQYLRYPSLTEGLYALDSGLLGTPQTLYLSVAHDYHAASLIRRLLLVQNEAYTVRGETAAFPIVETDSRLGPVTDGHLAEKQHTVLYIVFSSGKRAVYDFSGVQYRSFIRSRHLTLRCDRGEWSDDAILYLDSENIPKQKRLAPIVPEKYRALASRCLFADPADRGPGLRLDSAQDEFAVSSMLLDMGEYLRGGPEPYDFKDALRDAYFWALIKEAERSPWDEISSRRMPWDTQEVK